MLAYRAMLNLLGRQQSQVPWSQPEHSVLHWLRVQSRACLTPLSIEGAQGNGPPEARRNGSTTLLFQMQGFLLLLKQ